MAASWNDFATKAAQQEKKGGTPCSVRTLFEAIGPKAAAQVHSALADPGLTTAAIWRELQSRVGDQAPARAVLASHRRGDCACNPERER